MESEKVKEIKECLQSCNDDKMACYDCKYYEKCEKILTKNNILTLINELESENELLRNAKVVYETVDYCYEDLKKAEKRIAKLEKENAKYKRKLTINQWMQEIRKEALKQFAEKLKGKLQDFGDGGEKGAYITEKDIDETLKEFIK